MDFDGNFRLLGKVDGSLLCDQVAALTEDDWASDSFRQKQFVVHQQTQSIPLVFDNDWRFGAPTRQPFFAQFELALAPIVSHVGRLFEPESYLLRLLLTRLPAGCSISEHVDKGLSLRLVHRLHIPLQSKGNVMFTVGEQTRSLPVGEIWEINNCRAHSVVNESDVDRIHLIMDWVTPELARAYLMEQVRKARYCSERE